MQFEQFATATAHDVSRIMELTGVAIIAVGAIVTLAVFLYRTATGVELAQTIGVLRANLGRAILLGLEFLVAGDIINTVAIEPTLVSVAVLGGIVIIRTFLSFSLEVEIEGRWPWQRKPGDARKV